MAPGLTHTERVLAVLREPANRSPLAGSWRRCLLDHRLDPERAEPPRVADWLAVRLARDRSFRLMRAAEAELDRLFALVSGLGYHVLLTDRDGLVMARRVPDGDESGCRRWYLWTGTDWGEAAEGTNGVGTCLVERRPVTIHRDQHFRQRHTGLTCTVAPLFDAAGELAGALDASSFRPDPSGKIVPLVMVAVRQAARRIEQACFFGLHARRLVLALPEGPDDVSVPLVALDSDRRVVGATHGARQKLGLQGDLRIGPLGLGDLLFPSEPSGMPGFAQAERAVVTGALAQTSGNVTAAARLLGISRATLHRKIRRFSLRPERHVS
jgi:transcriptional regulator of acetoin/glycerol metabolism